MKRIMAAIDAGKLKVGRTVSRSMASAARSVS